MFAERETQFLDFATQMKLLSLGQNIEWKLANK